MNINYLKTKQLKRHFIFYLVCKKNIMGLLLVLTLCPLALSAQDWPMAQQEAKAGARWWWFGSSVDTTNLKWNIQQYANHGLGALEITPIYGIQGNEANEIPYLSDKWMEMLRYTEHQGDINKVEIDMTTGTGWPFGGPWVPIDETASKALFITKNIKDKNIKDLDISPSDKDLAKSKLLKVMAYGENGQVLDITANVTTKNNLYFLSTKLPQKGNWKIYALYNRFAIMQVKRSAPGGEGFVIDHFNKNAVQHYLKHISDAFERTHTPFPHTFFNDSYEVSEGDWTPILLEEFKKRKGYKLEEYLPQLQNEKTALEKNDKTPEQVIMDYRETLSDLLLENFTTTWTSWAHEHHAITRNQAHGSPANLIDLYAAVDIPEIEGFGLSDFGIKGLRKDSGYTRPNYSDLSMLKYAPSAAHITGKALTSSETFTWLTEHFRTSLSQMKPDMDLMFISGVNHMFFHGTAYSPKDAAWPGWKFYASIDMSPTNSIWRDAPYFLKYIQRCQSFLQWGKPDNDFLVYLPIRDMWTKDLNHKFMQFSIHNMNERSPEFIKAVLSINAAGFDCDYISERYILSTKYVNGMLQTVGGTRYKALIITNKNTLMAPNVRQHIEDLRAQGANIIYGIDTTAMNKAACREEMNSKYHLKMIRRSNSKGWHYFISNLTPNNVNNEVKLAVPFQTAMWFNPMTGERYAAKINNGKINIDLSSGESMILETFTQADETLLKEIASLGYRKDTPYDKTGKLIRTGWKLHFEDSTPQINKTYNINTLTSWENIDDSTRILMGTGVYECSLKLTAQDLQGSDTWAINLGDVRESARVYINDQFVGCAWSVPYTLYFTKKLHKGFNKIRIEVTNLPANRISDMDRKGMNWRKMKDINIVDINYKHSSYADWSPVSSGLNSHVLLYKVK